jgi:hypothetical protein
MNTEIAEPIVQYPSTDPYEMLIKEARQVQRRHRRRRWTTVVVLMVLVAAVTVVAAGGGRSRTPGSTLKSPTSSRSSAPPPLGSQVNSTSLGLNTTVDSVDMLSSTLGYSIISNDPFHPTSPVYLAVTHSGGARWAFVKTLPPSSYRVSGGEYIPTFHFVDSTTGYLSSSLATGVFETTDAGTTWRFVRLSGSLTGWEFNGSTMVTVSRACPTTTPAAKCPAYVALFRDGMPTSRNSASVPLIAGVDAQTVVPLAVTASGQIIVMEGAQGGGGEPGAGALIATTNHGTTWRRLADPCGIEAEGDQLIALNSNRWLLSCFLGEGMNQGKSSIWQTSDGGAAWGLVNRATDSSTTTSDVGNGGGVSTTVAPSGDGRILFGAMQGAIGGVEVSRDGGAHWTTANLDGQGGAPETLSTFGRKGALDDVDGGLIYRTTNGRNWSVLPLLPAGKYDGISICRESTVTATLSATHVKGIPSYYPVVFKNFGAHTCYLEGAPIAQPNVGTAAVPVGVPATRNVNFPAHAVVLLAHGGLASLGLSIDLGDASALGYPSSYCHPKRVTAISLRFSSPSVFTVALPSGGGEVCAAAPSSGVGFVVSGVGALSRS